MSSYKFGIFTITMDGIYTSYNGVLRTDWWGDIEEMDKFISSTKRLNNVDFLSEIREEAYVRIKSRNYPPGFNYYYLS